MPVDEAGLYLATPSQCYTVGPTNVPTRLELQPLAPLALTALRLARSDAGFPTALTLASPSGVRKATCATAGTDCVLDAPVEMAPGAPAGTYTLEYGGQGSVVLAGISMRLLQ